MAANSLAAMFGVDAPSIGPYYDKDIYFISDCGYAICQAGFGLDDCQPVAGLTFMFTNSKGANPDQLHTINNQFKFGVVYENFHHCIFIAIFNSACPCR